MRIALYTLGCKVNQYESQAMEALLLARGHHLVPFTDQADVYLINSCTETGPGGPGGAVRLLSPGLPRGGQGIGG